MNKTERALYELNRIERSAEGDTALHRTDARAKLLVCLAFLLCLLSVRPDNLFRLGLFFLYPIMECRRADIRYGLLFRRSLVVLPVVLFIGLFNPWMSFVGIAGRGLASAQAVFLLILSTGFPPLCRAMQRLGVPALPANQLLFVYRYLFVLLQEALNMQRACRSRSFGRTSYPLKQWGVFIGQLLLRTLDRSERIHRAMLSRGFNGSIPVRNQLCWQKKDTAYLISRLLFLLFIRFFPFQILSP